MALFTDRDNAVLLFILRYKYVDKEQIQTHILPVVGESATYKTYKKVVDKLKEAKYIKTSIVSNVGRKQLVVHYVTDKGAKYIEREIEDGTLIVQQSYEKVTSPIQSMREYHHRKLMSDFRIALDKSMAEHERLHEIFCHTDTKYIEREPITRITHETDDKLRIDPDIAFGLRSYETGGELLFLVEIDTGKVTIQGRTNPFKKDTMADKYYRYIQIHETEHFRHRLNTTANSYTVLTVTEKQSHIEGLQKKLHHVTKYPDKFLFATHSEVQEFGAMEGEIWQTLAPNSSKISLNSFILG